MALYYFDKYSCGYFYRGEYGEEKTYYNKGIKGISKKRTFKLGTDYGYSSNGYYVTGSTISNTELDNVLKRKSLSGYYYAFVKDSYTCIYRATSVQIGNSVNYDFNYNFEKKRKRDAVEDKKDLIEKNLIAEENTYPINGKHNDGFWYIRKELAWVPPCIKLNINKLVKNYDNGYIKVNNYLKQIDKIWTKVNNSLKEV